MKRIYNWFRKAVSLIAFLFMSFVIIALILVLMELIAMIVCHFVGATFSPWPVAVCILTILIIDLVLIILRARAVYGGIRTAAKELVRVLLED